MLDDIAISGEFFDADFFAYREDADLAWRAQLLGWKCLYNPQAVANQYGLIQNSQYGLPNVWQATRNIRLSAKFTF